MTERPKCKRVLRRGMLIAVLLLAVYVSQYFAAFWLAGNGVLRPQSFDLMLDTIYYPMAWLAFTPLPMSPYVAATAACCRTRGEGKEMTWSEWYAYHEGARTGNPPPYPR